MSVNRTTNLRIAALRRFALAITFLNLFGHTLLGFEQSWAQPLAALAAAYLTTLIIELVLAWSLQRKPLFTGGWIALVDFLLPAHITGLAVAMLLYANDRLWPIAFAAAVGICFKSLFRAPIANRTTHFFNPSNIGITVVLLLFPWVGIAPPYHFTENISGAFDWLLPLLIVVSGTFLNGRFTRKMPLIWGWLGSFTLLAIVRSLIFGAPIEAALVPMTGLAFVLFTFYMVTDPGTTPFEPRAQVIFGIAVALVYQLLMVIHVVFGLFFALTIICTIRGIGLHAQAWAKRRASQKLAVQMTVADGVH